jgi:DNA (cytosine-5)-methyltransferase 1
MRVLNLYAGIGGNRKLWGREHDIVAVEKEPDIADAYHEFFPDDKVVVGDAHQYLLDHYEKFDFIWSSPPCPTHSRISTLCTALGRRQYPEMSLYQEIIWLEHFFDGLYVVENVIPFYAPLIKPAVKLFRHCFWANFSIKPKKFNRPFKKSLLRASAAQLSTGYGIKLPARTKNKRKLLRNVVLPELGEYLLDQAIHFRESL